MDIQGYPWLSMESLGSVWGHFGITLGLLWDQFGVTLEYFGINLVSLWCHFGSLWGRPGVSFGSLGNNFGVHFGISLG